MDKTTNYDKLPITNNNGKEVIGFDKYMRLDKFARQVFYGSISLKEAAKMRDEMELKIKEVKKYNPRIPERKYLQKIILDNGQKLLEGRDMIVEAFRKHTFRFFEETEDSESDSEFDDSEFDLESDLESDSEQKSGKSIGERLRLRRQEYNELNELIVENGKIINKNLFRKSFEDDSLSNMQSDLYGTRNIYLNETKVNLIEDKLDSF